MSLGFHEITLRVVLQFCGNCASRRSPIADKTYGGHAYHDCLDTAHADHVPVVYPRAWMVWRTDDGVTLHFIGPSLPFSAERTPSTTTPSHVSWNTNNFACQEVGAIVKRLLCTSWRGFVK